MVNKNSLTHTIKKNKKMNHRNLKKSKNKRLKGGGMKNKKSTKKRNRKYIRKSLKKMRGGSGAAATANDESLLRVGIEEPPKPDVFNTEVKTLMDGFTEGTPLPDYEGMQRYYPVGEQFQGLIVTDEEKGEGTVDDIPYIFKYTNIFPSKRFAVVETADPETENPETVYSADFVYTDNVEKFTPANAQYIAASCPKTEDKMNKLLTLTQPSMVIMVTGVIEKDRQNVDQTKCTNYFSNANSLFGDVVSGDDQIVGLDVRTATESGGLPKGTTHYHYRNWPDHGVPTKVDDALKKIIDTAADYLDGKGAKRPILVHCSAGVGRTGTLLMMIEAKRLLRNLSKAKSEIPTDRFSWLNKLSLLTEQGQVNEGNIDILARKLLIYLRHFRPQLVQGDKQFGFVKTYINILAEALPEKAEAGTEVVAGVGTGGDEAGYEDEDEEVSKKEYVLQEDLPVGLKEFGTDAYWTTTYVNDIIAGEDWTKGSFAIHKQGIETHILICEEERTEGEQAKKYLFYTTVKFDGLPEEDKSNLQKKSLDGIEIKTHKKPPNANEVASTTGATSANEAGDNDEEDEEEEE